MVLLVVFVLVSVYEEREEDRKHSLLGGETETEFHDVPHWVLQGDLEVRHLHHFSRCEPQLGTHKDRAMP